LILLEGGGSRLKDGKTTQNIDSCRTQNPSNALIRCVVVLKCLISILLLRNFSNFRWAYKQLPSFGAKICSNICPQTLVCPRTLFGTDKRLNQFQGSQVKVSVSGSPMNNTTCYKYLCVHLDLTFNFEMHFQKIYKEAVGRVNLLQRIQY